MFGTLAGIGGLLLLFHIVAIGYGVGVKKEESCRCEEEIKQMKKEVEGLKEKVVKEMRAREELWLRDQMYAAELRGRDERMEAYMQSCKTSTFIWNKIFKPNFTPRKTLKLQQFRHFNRAKTTERLELYQIVFFYMESLHKLH